MIDFKKKRIKRQEKKGRTVGLKDDQEEKNPKEAVKAETSKDLQLQKHPTVPEEESRDKNSTLAELMKQRIPSIKIL